MDKEDVGLCAFLFGAAAVLFGSVVYGLITGEMPTVVGGRYESEVIWQSLESEPRYFWATLAVHLGLGGGAASLGWWLKKGKE